MNTSSEQTLSRLLILAHFEPVFFDIAWKELELIMVGDFLLVTCWWLLLALSGNAEMQSLRLLKGF